MRGSTRTSMCLLTDACSVIETHRVGARNALVHGWRVHVPGAVMEEVRFRLGPRALSGAIHRVDATAEEMEEVYDARRHLPESLRNTLGTGERECLAILLCRRISGLRLCTADRLAVRAACLLGLSHQLVSLEEALRVCAVSKPLKPQYRQSWLKRVLMEERVRAVQAWGSRLGRT